MKSVSDFIGRGLVEHNISVPQLAKISGVNKRAIESYLYQGVNPSLDKFLKIAAALGYQVEMKKAGVDNDARGIS